MFKQVLSVSNGTHSYLPDLYNDNRSEFRNSWQTGSRFRSRFRKFRQNTNLSILVPFNKYNPCFLIYLLWTLVCQPGVTPVWFSYLQQWKVSFIYEFLLSAIPPLHRACGELTVSWVCHQSAAALTVWKFAEVSISCYTFSLFLHLNLKGCVGLHIFT